MKKEKEKNKLKKVIIISFLIAIILIGVTIAYFQTEFDVIKTVETANFSYESTNTFTANNAWLPGDTDNPTLTVTNTGNTPIVIRATIEEEWKDSSNNILPNKSNGVETVLKQIGTSWKKLGNYYYYNGSLAANTTTQTSLITQVTFNPAIVETNCQIDPLNENEASCDGSGGYGNSTYKITVNYEILQASAIEDEWKLSVADINTGGPKELYNMMKVLSVPDNKESEYVSNPNGIEFNHISSNTNGKGIYEYSDGIYYYRGDVDNNVIFDNKCWQIIRTTASGTVKMIYNGTPSNGTCPTHRGAAANVTTRAFNSSYNNVDYAKYRTSEMKTYIEGTFLPTISAAAQAQLATTTFYLEGDTITPASGTFSGTAGKSYAPANRIWGFDQTDGAFNSATANSQVEAMTKSKLYIDRGSDTYKSLVGLIQADEVILAGGRGYGNSSNNGANSTYYLHSGALYWTISPWGFTSNGYAHVVNVYGDGDVGADNVDDSGGGVRPVVSLRSGTTYGSGNGSSSSPYLVDTLYNKIRSQAVSDTESSTYVTNSNGIEFNHISSDTNGKGVYDFGNGIYYYRGAVDNNNVLFDNKCWQIIRTTASGNIKMIYNGTPSNGTCPTHRGSSANVTTRAFNSSYNNVDYAKYRTSAMKTYIEGTFLPTISAAAQAKLAQTTFYLEGDTVTPASGTFSGSVKQSYAPSNRIWGFDQTDGAWNNATANTQVESMTKSKLYIDRGSDTYDALIGLIQADEVILAGGRGWGDSSNTGGNSSYYLHSGAWYWTISPWGFHSDGHAYVVRVVGDGHVRTSNVNDSGGGVRPVISLKPEVVVSGNGTTATPYQVQ